MPRLLIVSTVPDTLEAFMLPLAGHMKSHGWQVDAMARGAPGRPRIAAAFDRVWDAAWSRKMFDPRNLTVGRRHVERVVRSEKYDIVHVHTPIAAFVTRLALRAMRRSGRPKVIYTAHGFHFYQGASPVRYWTFLALEKLAARWTDYLLLVNNEDETAALKHRLVPPEHLFHARGVGVDTEKFSRSRFTDAELERTRAGIGIDQGAPLFLTVAEFIPRKRHEDVIRAFARLGATDAHLALAGTGPLLEDMRGLAAELGIADRVHFLGFRRDIPELMAASTAVVLASLQEGLPTCLIEAQSIGTPAIGSNIRGTRDLLLDQRGYLFPVGDVAELSAQMRRVLDDPDEACAIAARGHAAAEGQDVQTVNAVYELLYTKALETAAWDNVPA